MAEAPAAKGVTSEDGVVRLGAPPRLLPEEEMVDDVASPVPEPTDVKAAAERAEDEDEDEDDLPLAARSRLGPRPGASDAEEAEESAEAHSSGTSSLGKRSAADMDGACTLRRGEGGSTPTTYHSYHHPGVAGPALTPAPPGGRRRHQQPIQRV